MKKTITKRILLAALAFSCLGNTSNAQWVAANTGLTSNNVNSLAASGTNLLCGTFNGLFISSDNGSNWTAVADTTFINQDVKQVVANGANVFAALQGRGIFKSTDNGLTWAAINSSFTSLGGGYYACSITMSGSTIYAGLSYDGLYMSSDNGVTWTKSNSSALNGATINTVVTSGANLLAASNGCGAAGGGKVYISNDNGVNWTTTTIDARSSGGLAVIGNMVFASTLDGVLKSSDNGVTWTTTTNVSGVVDNASSLTAVGSNLIVGSPYGMHSSSDNGVTWVDISSGAGASNLSVSSFAVNGANFFCGNTFHSVGVYRRAVSEIGGTTGISNLTNQQGINVSPNPSTDGIFNITLNAKNTSLKVSNLLGELVYSESLATSSPNRTLNLGHLPAGIYLLQVADGANVGSQKLVIQK